MTLIGALVGAGRGWAALLRGDADWRSHFRLSRAGLVIALVTYLLFAFLVLVYGALGLGGMSATGLVIGLLVFSLYPWLLVIATFGVRIALQRGGPILDLLVPGIYALLVHLVGGAILTNLGPPLVIVAIAVTAYLLMQLGRVAAGWSLPVAIIYGVLTGLLLAAMPVSLYMLADLFISPA